MPHFLPSRRDLLLSAAALALKPRGLAALAVNSLSPASTVADTAPASLPHARPAESERKFRSTAVENLIVSVKAKIKDPALAVIFENCYPNTLDTTVTPGTFEGKPDTYVVTGDIDAMWLRDSSAQVWPYLSLVNEDPNLHALIEGLIRRQARLSYGPDHAHPRRRRAQVGDRLALLPHSPRPRLLARSNCGARFNTD
jgi:hypothetical protein